MDFLYSKLISKLFCLFTIKAETKPLSKIRSNFSKEGDDTLLENLNNFKFFFNFRFLSKITKSGLFFSNPSILQSKLELSSLIDFEVEIKQLYIDLIKCDLFWE